MLDRTEVDPLSESNPRHGAHLLLFVSDVAAGLGALAVREPAPDCHDRTRPVRRLPDAEQGPDGDKPCEGAAKWRGRGKDGPQEVRPIEHPARTKALREAPTSVKSLATAPPISRAIATPLGLDRAPRGGVCGCWEAVGKWPAGATVESLA